MKNNDTCRSTDLSVNVSLPFDSVSISANLHTESVPAACLLALNSSASQDSNDKKGCLHD